KISAGVRVSSRKLPPAAATKGDTDCVLIAKTSPTDTRQYDNGIETFNCAKTVVASLRADAQISAVLGHESCFANPIHFFSCQFRYSGSGVKLIHAVRSSYRRCVSRPGLLKDSK